jgi:hypothetical protein
MSSWLRLLSCIVNPPPLSSDVLGAPIVLDPFADSLTGWLLLGAALALGSALLVFAAWPERRTRPRGGQGLETAVAWPFNSLARRWSRQLAGVIRRSRLERPSALLATQGPGVAGGGYVLENDARRPQIARHRRRHSS